MRRQAGGRDGSAKAIRPRDPGETVSDYEPLDLSSLCNLGLEVLADPSRAPLGQQQFHGLPFLVGSPDAAPDAALVGFGVRGGWSGSVRIPIGRPASWVIVAHATIETELFSGGFPGGVVARYVFSYANGERVEVPVRERFEIAASPKVRPNRSVPLDWGQLPFLAWPDAPQTLMPRTEGRYDEAGARLLEVFDPQTRAPYVLPYSYYLWPWRNPRPEVELAELEVVPGDTPFFVAGVTLSGLDEEPFARTVAQPVIIELEDDHVGDDLALLVDRGTATYVQPLVGSPGENSGRWPPGWGGRWTTPPRAGYSRVAAIDSATLTVRRGGQMLGLAGWRALREAGAVAVEKGVRLRVVDEDLTWVRTTVVDADSGRSLPCRMHFRSANGIPYPPVGHPAQINSGMGTWNLDIGGDLRLGDATYAYVDGTCEGWLPCGEVVIEVARGFEYEPVERRIVVEANQAELTIPLRRIADLRRERYFSGDTHVHFLSTQGAELEARCEDLSVVNLQLSQWGHMYSNVEDFRGAPFVSADGETVVYAGQEVRQTVLGHILLLGASALVAPWGTGGAEDAELGGGLQTTLSDWADQCHALGGTVVLAHFPVPNCEVAALVATGRADAIEMIASDEYNVQEYYRYLNAGYELPLVAGTDKMTAEVPVGLFRTYARIPHGEPFEYRSWLSGVRAGDTFISSGPLLCFSVDGFSPGSTVRLDERGGSVIARASALSVFPIERLEIVVNGEVVAVSRPEGTEGALEVVEEVRVDCGSWVAARCLGANEASARHRDMWSRGVLAHTSPIYVACGDRYERFDGEVARYMITLLEGGLEYLRAKAPRRWPGSAHQRHRAGEHLAFLERPFHEGIEEIRRRIDAWEAR